MVDMVTTVLTLPTTQRIVFTFGAVIVNSVSFGLVVTAIANGRISIVTNPRLGAGFAKYRYSPGPTGNRFIFGFASTAGSADREALIVHEAVHAAFDVAVSPMMVKQSEAAAYIAQCLYFYYKHEADFVAGRIAATFAHPMLQAAWPVSQRVLVNPNLTDADVAPLLAVIASHSLYSARADLTDEYDGV